MKLPTLARATVGQVLSVHLVFEPFGWATFYVDDTQGTLSIESDWGSWAYRWGRGANLGVEPHDLSLAIATGFGADYIARKRVAGATTVYDEVATRSGMRQEVLRLRRKQEISAEDAACVWEVIEQGDFSSEAGVERVAWDSSVTEILADREPWDWIEHGECPRFALLRDQLLPLFIAELRKAVQA